jgi:hypothetical protein
MTLHIFFTFLFLALASNLYGQELRPSFVSVPFEVPTKEIESKLNQSFKGLIFQDTSFEDNELDLLKMKVWKKSDIKLITKNDTLLFKVPLKIWINKAYEMMYLRSYHQSDFELMFYIGTKIQLNANYTISTKSFVERYEWLKEPTLKVAGVDWNITKWVKSALDKQLSTISSIIDQQAKEQLNFKPMATDLWNDYSKPSLISPEYKAWMITAPQKIYATPLTIQNNKIIGKIGFDLLNQVYIADSMIPVKPIAQVPNLTLLSQIKDTFSIRTHTYIPYQQATDIARKRFIDSTYSFQEGKYQVVVKDIEMYYEDNKMVFKNTLSGSYNGIVYIQGNPYYDSISQKIKLQNTEFQLKTKNILHKTVAWLFEGKIERNIESNFEMEMTPYIEKSKQETLIALNREYRKGFFVKGDVLDMKMTYFEAKPNYMETAIDTKATIKAIIDGMYSR